MEDPQFEIVSLYESRSKKRCMEYALVLQAVGISPGAQEGPCAGQEARHQERQRRPALLNREKTGNFCEFGQNSGIFWRINSLNQ